MRCARTSIRTKYGGAPLLGVNGVAIIAHGSSNARAIRNAIRAASNEALVHQVNAEIVDILAKSEAALGAKPARKGIRGIFAKMRDRLSRSKEAEERERRINAGALPCRSARSRMTTSCRLKSGSRRTLKEERSRKEHAEHPRRNAQESDPAVPSSSRIRRRSTATKSTGELHLQNGDKARRKTRSLTSTKQIHREQREPWS